MDIATAPKLLAAVLLGATVATTVPRQTVRGDSVSIKLEWISSGRDKRSESVVMRAVLESPTVLTQGNRTIRVTPAYGDGGNGDYAISLNVSGLDQGAPIALDTQVRAHSGETVIVMGTTNKASRQASERLLFLTATGI